MPRKNKPHMPKKHSVPTAPKKEPKKHPKTGHPHPLPHPHHPEHEME